MTSNTEETVPLGAVELMGQIVSANVANLAHATDLVEQGLREEIRSLALTITGMAEVFEQATVVDRATERRMRRFDPLIENAYRTLERSDT